MSGTVLDIYITGLGDPYVLDQDETWPNWVVAIAHADGRVLDWSLGRYRYHDDDPWIPIPVHTPFDGTPGNWYESIPVRDGHVQIEVPPGLYAVRATHSRVVSERDPARLLGSRTAGSSRPAAATTRACGSTRRACGHAPSSCSSTCSR